jgi:hypothetical protein
MNLNDIIEEMINNAGSMKAYSAYEQPARKDFIPLNQSDYNFQYSQNVRPGGERLPEPPIQGAVPWPLEGVVDDFTTSYVNLYTAGQKINASIKANKALSDNQKEELKKFLKDIKTILNHVKTLGSKIVDVSKIN